MNSSQSEQFKLALQQARKAFKAGDKNSARDFARQATRLNPDNEESWLILASVSTPRQSIAYFNKALQINPNSQTARKGLHWAVQRERKKEPQVKRQGKKVTLAKKVRPEPQPVKTSKKGKDSKKTQKKDSHKPRGEYWPVYLFFLLVALGLWLAYWLGSPLLTITASEIVTAPRPEGVLLKPTLMPTSQPLPSATPFPASTAIPTMTMIPTSAPVENKTYASYYAHSWDIPDQAASIHDFWLEVDLSEQMVYAYDGSTLLNSFLVSTGTSEHPTVTGSYKIYAMYTYYSMRGPGYYLPDVPYSMFFYKGYSLHGTYWHSNFGTPMSHGCVNMETSAAAWVYERARIGTNVIVHY